MGDDGLEGRKEGVARDKGVVDTRIHSYYLKSEAPTTS